MIVSHERMSTISSKTPSDKHEAEKKMNGSCISDLSKSSNGAISDKKPKSNESNLKNKPIKNQNETKYNGQRISNNNRSNNKEEKCFNGSASLCSAFLKPRCPTHSYLSRSPNILTGGPNSLSHSRKRRSDSFEGYHDLNSLKSSPISSCSSSVGDGYIPSTPRTKAMIPSEIAMRNMSLRSPMGPVSMLVRSSPVKTPCSHDSNSSPFRSRKMIHNYTITTPSDSEFGRSPVSWNHRMNQTTNASPKQVPLTVLTPCSVQNQSECGSSQPLDRSRLPPIFISSLPPETNQALLTPSYARSTVNTINSNHTPNLTPSTVSSVNNNSLRSPVCTPNRNVGGSIRKSPKISLTPRAALPKLGQRHNRENLFSESNQNHKIPIIPDFHYNRSNCLKQTQLIRPSIRNIPTLHNEFSEQMDSLLSGFKGNNNTLNEEIPQDPGSTWAKRASTNSLDLSVDSNIDNGIIDGGHDSIDSIKFNINQKCLLSPCVQQPTIPINPCSTPKICNEKMNLTHSDEQAKRQESQEDIYGSPHTSDFFFLEFPKNQGLQDPKQIQNKSRSLNETKEASSNGYSHQNVTNDDEKLSPTDFNIAPGFRKKQNGLHFTRSRDITPPKSVLKSIHKPHTSRDLITPPSQEEVGRGKSLFSPPPLLPRPSGLICDLNRGNKEDYTEED